jgi:NAD(P)H dehydrogenase (quinone)
VAASDVAAVAAEILRHPPGYAGRAIELTGPHSADLYGLAEEYAAGLGRPVRYEEVPLDVWRDTELQKCGLPDHVYAHILTMAKLHAADRYNRRTDAVETILHRPATNLKTTLDRERSTFRASPSAEQA